MLEGLKAKYTALRGELGEYLSMAAEVKQLLAEPIALPEDLRGQAEAQLSGVAETKSYAEAALKQAESVLGSDLGDPWNSTLGAVPGGAVFILQKAEQRLNSARNILLVTREALRSILISIKYYAGKVVEAGEAIIRAGKKVEAAGKSLFKLGLLGLAVYALAKVWR